MADRGKTLEFLKAQGTRLVNEQGEEVFLRGMNLGNWFLTEGYMWKFPHKLSSQRKMETLFTELLGPEKAADFWEAFFDRFIREPDIRKIAAEGFNSIRLPLNHRLFVDGDGEFIEPMMRRIDILLDWCEQAGLYVILDLHAAPGGQTGTNIDDSDGHPDLFTAPENAARTVTFWRKFARRYRDRAIVGGYDLLNEPLPREQNQYYGKLMDLYQQIILAIREEDSRHIIILECAHWATDFRIFTEKLDDNMVIQFHKYWCPTDYRFVRDYLNLRETLNVPLWMGESGENSNDWYVSSFQMLEDYNISWCFWPWKKLDSRNNPCSVPLPECWEKIGQHALGELKLGAEVAEAILNELLDNILFENCEYRPEVLRAMMRRVPFRIPAESYGLKGVGTSYYFTDKVTTCVNFRREEGANIKFVIPKDDELPKYDYPKAPHVREEDSLCLILQAGDWVKYEVNAVQDTPMAILAHACGNPEAELELWLDSVTPLSGPAGIGNGWHRQTLAEKKLIPAGKHTLKVIVTKGSLHLDWIECLASDA